jgi:hypothetical protein
VPPIEPAPLRRSPARFLDLLLVTTLFGVVSMLGAIVILPHEFHQVLSVIQSLTVALGWKH